MIELKEKYTIALVTHNMQQAMWVADTTAFFGVDISQGSRTGYLVEMGPTKKIFEEPEQQLTRQYKAGAFVEPTLSSGQAALAANVGQIPSNLRVFLPDPEGQDSYSIVTFTWLLLHDQYPDPRKSAALKGFVGWALADGQRYSGDEGYIPLPDGVTTLVRAAVDRVR